MENIRIHQSSNGILIEHQNVKIIIDPNGSGSITNPDIILISHAHTDHICGVTSLYKPGMKVIMSPETFRILSLNGYKFLSNDLVLLKPGEQVSIKGVLITARNAGHIVGSLMYELDLGRIVVGYTGDFNFEDSIIMRGADMIDADILLIDSTYGHPTFSFPPRKILYKIIREKLKEAIDCGFIPSLHGYALGKGQELTRLAWEFIGGKVSVDNSVGIYNKIFEDVAKKPLGNYIIGGLGDVLIRGFKRQKGEPPIIKRIFFTGWAVLSNKKTTGIPLSSHNSFTRLVDYIIRTQAERIITVFNYESFFAEFIERELGIPASPISQVPTDISYKPKNLKRRRSFVLDFYF